MIAQRLAPFGTTIFTEMTLLANKHGAVNLAQGFPDFDGPSFFLDAAAEALQGGQNQYARMFGLPALNRALADRWQRATGAEIDPDAQVTVTSGCTEAIAAAMLGLVNPGDEVILFEPFYDSYRASVAMAGGVPRFVTLREPTGAPRDGLAAPGAFWFDPDELRRAFSDRTRLILINTPHNPTGKVFTREELTLAADLCTRNNAIALTDEVYEHLTYEPDQPHIRMATLPGMAERTLTLSSLGKTFSLTGWKIGWAIGTPDLTRAVRAAHQFLTFATATPLQAAAASALARTDDCDHAIGSLVADLKAARGLLAGALARLGFGVHIPAGAYFILADFTRRPGALRPDNVPDDAAFCRSLPAAAGVAAVPPSVFYQNRGLGAGLVRFAFCKRPATLHEAVRRLGVWATDRRADQ
ncbi:MAG: aminotransferase class I/II-fold pyridoxal phosphate-dependent enzyme [Phycisphaeraceae bacterium]|nr:aminotransferase class I/II-fold pyridoxal phosphate-dependent enzyme [Phycisphaeraceae bacterium]